MGTSVASRLAAFAAIACLMSSGAVLASAAACGDGGTGGQGTGGAGGGGTGGAPGCPEEVAPLFTLRVLAAEGQLPDDLQLNVSWSAGDEPTVELADASTYGTYEDNVVCVRSLGVAPTGAGGGSGGGAGGDGGGALTTSQGPGQGAGGGAPADELLCELWTSGPTRVKLEATGYLPFDETLPPATTDGCERPVPSEVEVDLVVEEPDEE